MSSVAVWGGCSDLPGGCCSGEKYDPENNNRLHIKIQLYWTLYFGSSCMVGCVENNQLATTNERRTHITRVQTRVWHLGETKNSSRGLQKEDTRLCVVVVIYGL